MAGGCDGPPKFTRIEGADLGRTLAGRLVKTVDRLRDLYTRFGLRPYRVRIIRTRWTGPVRGLGEEVILRETLVEPTPLVSDLTSLAEIVQPVGLDEVGAIGVSEISGRYSEDQLRGQDPAGQPPSPDEQVFWEIEFRRLDGQPGERRRFFVRAAPTYRADSFEWSVRLEKANENRARSGELR